MSLADQRNKTKYILKKQLERRPSALVLVGYDRENTIRSLSILDLIIKEWPISRSILVLNSDIGPEVEAAISIDSWQVIRGSNNDNEFSGYQEGLDALRTLSASIFFSNVIFANDTLAKRDSFLRTWMLERALAIFTSESRCKIVGKKGRVPGDTEFICSLQLREWICTYFFSIDWFGLKLLDFKINYTDDVRHLLRTKYSSSHLLSDSTDPLMKRRIEKWLLHGGWYGSIKPPLTNKDFEKLSAKALMILSENMLSAKAASLGLKLVGTLNHRRLDSMKRFLLGIPTY